MSPRRTPAAVAEPPTPAAGVSDQIDLTAAGAELRWTPARLRGLLAFARTGCARESNCTDQEAGTVYWQTREWLSRNRLIAIHLEERRSGWFYELTAAGKAALEELS